MDFEKRYVIDNSREADGPRERHYHIELSDKEHLERISPPMISKETRNAGFVYKPPVADDDSLSPALKAKFEIARNPTKDTNASKSKSKSPKSKAVKI